MSISFKRNLQISIAISFTFLLLIVQHQMYQIPLKSQKLQEHAEDTSVNVTTYNRLPTQITVPFHSFEDGKPVTAVVLSYQRCGSSFFGDLFGKNPDAFYMFEPLDALYTSLYGTAEGWNVPSDITNYKNGSMRIPPDGETLAVSKFLRAILLCDIDSLPTELLVHRYLYNDFYQDESDYTKCIKNPIVRKLVVKCNSFKPKSYCGVRFGEKSEHRQRECYMMLNNATYRKERADTYPLFRKYLRCRKSLRRLVDTRCVHLFRHSCENRTLRAVKLVRSTMKSMEPLLRSLPNFRVIHLVRDPRPVGLSRQKFDTSALGGYTITGKNGSIMSREAKLFCSTVLRDISLSSELQKKYPGKIYRVMYEDFVANLKNFSKRIYEFVNSGNPVGTRWWQKRIGSRSGNESIGTSTKWKRFLTFKENKEIVDNCREFFSMTNYDQVY